MPGTWIGLVKGPAMAKPLASTSPVILGTALIGAVVVGLTALISVHESKAAREWREMRLQQMESGMTFSLKPSHLGDLGPSVASGWVHADTAGIGELSAIGNLIACVHNPEGQLRTTVVNFEDRKLAEARPEVIRTVARQVPDFEGFCLRARTHMSEPPQH